MESLIIGIILMFNSFFTTYQMVEPPPIVSKDVQLVQDSYKELQDKPLSTYSNNEISFDNIAVSLPDPLKTEIEAPIIFDEYKTPDSPKKDTKIKEEPILNLKLPNTPTKVTSFNGKEGYAKTMYQYLYKALEDNGIDGDTWAPVLVAHTSIESGWGNKFSRENNNFGGIKGKGSKVVSTNEWSPSRGYYPIKDTFKSYPSIQAFADDYVKKLKNTFKAFEGTPNDYLRNIKKRGYFTAPLSDYQRLLNGRLASINKLLKN